MAIYDRILRSLGSIYHEPFETMERLGEKFSLSWYPSSGKCFQDLLAWRRIRPFDFPEPDLMIHTDCCREIGFEKGDIIHKDKNTTVTITRKSQHLIDENNVFYSVQSPYAHFERRQRPELTLLEVQIESKQIGTFTKPVLFFHFENYNWFQQFVLQGGLKLSHMFKVCEGCGFGGNSQSISSMYGLLGHMGCKYLLADQEIHFDPAMAESLENFEFNTEWEHQMALDRRIDRGHFMRQREMRQQYMPIFTAQPFKINTIDRYLNLSGYETFIHEIKLLGHDANPDWRNRVLATISNGSAWYEPEWGPAF